MSTALTIYKNENLSANNTDNDSENDSYDIAYGENLSHLGDIGFDGNISSIEVKQGFYAGLYETSDYCDEKIALLPDQYKNLKDIGWNNKATSIKTYCRCAAILYTDTKYKGNSLIVSGDIMDLSQLGEENEISALKVMPGYQITLYTEKNLGGKSVTYDEDCSDIDKTVHGDVSSIKVTYCFGAEVYSEINFGGENVQLTASTFNVKNFIGFESGIMSIKVNPRYMVTLFSEADSGGTSLIYYGPCDITNIGLTAKSISIEGGHYAVRAYKQYCCAGEYIELITSVANLDIYGWSNQISSLDIDNNYFVEICSEAGYINDRIILAPENGKVDLKDDLENWNKEVCSIRIIPKNIPAVYLFEDGGNGGACVKLINNGTSNSHNWYWDGYDGIVNTLKSDALSSVLIIGDYKVTLFENKSMQDGHKLTLNGPGFYNLTAWATEKTKDTSIFDDKTEAISIEPNTPHPSVLSEVPGYQGLVLLRGDLHSHTLWSDAYWGGAGGINYIQDPCQTFRIYQDLGYDFAGVSDHVFGANNDGSERYSEGKPRSVPGLQPKYAMSEDEWENTEKQASKAEHNYNFASIAGYEYGLGGVAYEGKYFANNDYDMVAHYNVFCSTDFYYGKPGKWENNSENRKDFYQWAAKQYENNKDLIVQFNHPSKQGAAYNYFDSKEAVDENNQPCNRAAFSLCELLTVHADKEDRDFFDAYVNALNNGWKVGPTATSDNHDGIRALKDVYKNIRTVVAVDECSKDLVLDALRKHRVYATTRAGLNIGFSITNSAGETVIMGGDINSLSSDLNICIGLSGDLEYDEITAVKLHTNISEPLSLDITKSWPMLVNYQYASNDLNGLKYIFVVVETKKYHKKDDTQKYKTFAAATAPIWIID